ncbi:MAG: hypothetical protein QG673_948 [Pseudomonadota bacterium]|nr:hypothetical protein [Pseudomonadota bacterium]
MSVDRISSSSISRTGQVERIDRLPGSSDINAEYIFREAFDFSELPFNDEMRGDEDEIELLKQILLMLFQDVVLDGCQIVPRGALVQGQKRIEAAFRPPLTKKQKPTIYVPLPSFAHAIDAVDHFIFSQRSRVLDEVSELVVLLSQRLKNADLVKLIVLISHEYGHYISFRNGNHTRELKIGLGMLHSNMQFKNNADKYAFQVFSEEVTAWRIAEDRLKAYKFMWWNILDDIKYNSLKFYYKGLTLKDSSIDVYCNLSMLGVDLSIIAAANDKYDIAAEGVIP